ncbi:MULTISPECIES: ribonuclease D [Rhodococcus]|uniref:3'-5' exonuclease n=1 Tax=Rhodococcoides kyotonense TaxID=398843 RepID=A0A177YFY4_9NOCA|nr:MULTISPECIES: ribonuclease D [Rhodococcus]NIL76843.1 Ribonuclease D [Rhodococcus sp. B10]OAK54361.1 3'-5' exonuclease [Rhodococcus kyotonensis]
MSVTSSDDSSDTPNPVPLLAPADGVPDVVTTADGVRAAAELLAGGDGPLAVDAERASGFRYSQRAYLLQFRRRGAGTVLLDPIPVADALAPLAEVVNPLEWVLHSADQDLPGLAELGLVPASLYDTELAGRLAGFERVGLGAIVERMLGLSLQKGHGAADWSTRPLPETWLNYAALDVEVLVELRDAMAAELESQGKTEWARQEFEHILTLGPPKPKGDRWRKTSGIHSVKSPRVLAAVRELWQTRDGVAHRRDLAAGRVLPDSAIIAAATADPKTESELRALPVFGGPRQRRSTRLWLSALERARSLDARDLPPKTLPFDGPPPPSRWARKDPDAADRLSAVRAAMSELSENVSVPVENLLMPDQLRRLVWDWQPSDDAASFESRLTVAGARPWQRELVVPVLVEALTPPQVTDR